MVNYFRGPKLILVGFRNNETQLFLVSENYSPTPSSPWLPMASPKYLKRLKTIPRGGRGAALWFSGNIENKSGCPRECQGIIFKR